MSSTRQNSTEISDDMSTRTLSKISEFDMTLSFGVDLVSAAKRNVGFLRTVRECLWLHERENLVEAVRRYDQLWMPLISDLMMGSMPPMVLPPVDIEWVWFCHSLNPASYRQYCEKRFSKLIGKPAIFDEENEEYALMRCKELWMDRYPNEPFENETVSDSKNPVTESYEDLLSELKKQNVVCKFSLPYMSDVVYLIAARQRYKGFLYLLQRFPDDESECERLVPTFDISLMWVTHQSYPTVYAEDMKEMEADMEKVVKLWETVKKEEMAMTKKLWETAFDQPYDKAGGIIEFDGVASFRPPVYWDISDTDVNTRYRSLLPRFLLEVCVFVRLNSRIKELQEDMKRNFLQLQTVRCHRELKIHKSISSFSLDSWNKVSHVFCEFGTKGIAVELRKHAVGCFRTSKLEGTTTFLWNDLLRAPALTLKRDIDKQVKSVVSITPPVQASYLFKCVPDRVTDDSGAMISDVILRMNHYKPQEGRWLSRTVLDHAGRECFVVRMRVGAGFWRRGGETPSTVKWEEKTTEIREGAWLYVAGSIGKAPEKVVGTATPIQPSENWQAAWRFSTGEEFLIGLESSTSIPDLKFCLRNQSSPDSLLTVLTGRRMQYQSEKTSSGRKEQEEENKEENKQGRKEEENETGFVTLVRFTGDNQIGRATALLNWTLLVVEVSPAEDAVLALQICIAILRSVSEMRKEDVGGLLIRRRLKEAKLGARDWGSVLFHPSSCSSSISSPYVQPWHWNAKAVITLDEGVMTTPSASNYSPAEGGDKLYKEAIKT